MPGRRRPRSVDGPGATPDNRGMTDVTAYLDRLSPRTREAVDRVRAIVREELPEATESLSYGMPTFSLDGSRVVHVAGWAKHVSIYPVPVAEALQPDLVPYVSGRGTLKFPLSATIPYELIRRIVRALAHRQT